MILRFIPLFLALTFLFGCGGDPDQPQGTVIKVEPVDHEVFINPEFGCLSASVVEPGEGYPHPLQDFPRSADPERSVSQLEDFCGRMAERFAESGMTETEAKRVYGTIPSVLTISDESNDMPSPDDPAIPPVVLESRVMLRKVAEGRYELFFFRIGCGRNYSLYELDLTDEGVFAREIESWSERDPC